MLNSTFSFSRSLSSGSPFSLSVALFPLVDLSLFSRSLFTRSLYLSLYLPSLTFLSRTLSRSLALISRSLFLSSRSLAQFLSLSTSISVSYSLTHSLTQLLVHPHGGYLQFHLFGVGVFGVVVYSDSVYRHREIGRAHV